MWNWSVFFDGSDCPNVVESNLPIRSNVLFKQCRGERVAAVRWGRTMLDRIRQTRISIVLAGCVALSLAQSATGQTADESEFIVPEPAIDAKFAAYLDSELSLAQDQPSPSRTQPPAPDRTQRRPTQRLSSVPNMFGDFLGGGTSQAVFAPPPIVFRQIVSDGPFDLFVTNPITGPGAFMNPAVPIFVNAGASGVLVTQSNGVGADLSGDGQPDTYPINQPFIPGISPPPPPGAGVFVYNGGNAVFVNRQGPNTQETPADGSVGQADGWSLIFQHTFFPDQVIVNIPPGGGAAIRRIKISENTSPQPRCRVFFNYNFFNDVISGIGDVNRYTFGIEHCMADQTRSIELRVPFASTLAADQTAGVQSKNTEWGNLVFVGKQVLFQNDQSLISAGLGVAVPTGSDSRLFLPNGQQVLHINNNAVHLLPFVAALSSPSDRWFWQGFLQFDVDTNGNSIRGDLSGRNLNQFGVLQDTPLMFADVAGGYQLYQNPYGTIAGIAPVAELHYATTLQDADFANGNGFMLRDFSNRFDVVNLTLGTNILGRNGASIRPAFVIPLRTGDNKQFDYELQVQGNVAY
jgi:hypothetical protein